METARRFSLRLLPLALAMSFSSAVCGQTPGFDVSPYLQNATPTSIWIGWETTGGSTSTVDYGLTPGLGASTTGGFVDGADGSHIHHVQLTGLLPDTRYFYRAETDSWLGAIDSFRTPPAYDSAAPFRFVAYSDSQYDGSNPTKHEEIINDGVLDFFSARYGGPIENSLSFVILPGDLVSTGSNHSHWQDHFFAQARNLYRSVPLYPAPGNHEGNHPLYFKYFNLPLNGTVGYEEHWYAYDHQNVRIISMDTNSGYTIDAQLDWLDGVLAGACADDTIDFVFAQFHHPHKSELWTPGESGFSSEIVTRLEQFSDDCGKPSVHFFGHTHGYSRGQSRDHSHLMVNVATGGGNPDYWYEYAQADYPEFQHSSPEWGFVVLDVEGGADPTFHLRRASRGNEYVSRDNEIIDEVIIRRYNNGPTTPTAVDPSPGVTIPGYDVVLTGSTFSDPEGDEHLESQWQITEVSGDYSSPIVDVWNRSENWYRPDNGDGWYSVNTVADPDVSYVVLTDSLPGCSDLYWRVRYRDTGLVWSDWSAEQAFATGESDRGPFAPIPHDGGEAVDLDPILQWFSCEPVDSYDVYFGTDPLLGAGAFQGNQVATTFSPGALTPVTEYFWRIDRHIGGVVNPGNVWQFTTRPVYPTDGTTEWRFDDLVAVDDQPLLAVLGGSEMIPSGMLAGIDWDLGITDGTTVPHIGGEAATYLWLDNVFGASRGLETFVNAPGTGGGGCCDLFHFTIVWDLYLDASQDELQALWQGNAYNQNDAELFLDCEEGGFYVGGTGYIGSDLWPIGQWVRFAHRVDYAGDTSALFVNGTKVLDDTQLAAPDWLYGLGSGYPVWMLSDNGPDSDVSLMYCANLAIVDGLMPDVLIADLGGPKAAGIFVESVSEFIRGDANGDGGINLGDAVHGLAVLFSGAIVTCSDALDSNDDGVLNIADPVHILEYLFSGGPSPLFPFPGCGEDPTDDALECATGLGC